MVRTIILLVSLFHFTLTNVYSQYQFKKLDLNVGLKFVYSIYRDHEDYLWIGNIETGLVKFDGYNSYTYLFSAKDSTSISNNNIRSIFEDSNNNLWIGTRNGLNRYIRERDNFVHYYSDLNDSSSISSNSIYNIVEFQESGLWFLTKSGLDLYNKNSDSFKHFIPNKIENFKGFTDVVEDKNGNLWLSGNYSGLVYFNISTKNFEYYPDDNLTSATISGSSLYFDENGLIWLGYYGNGIAQFSPETKQYNHLPTTKNENGTNGSFVREIVNLNDSILLVGVDQGGINEYNKNTKKFRYITSTDRKYGNLSSDGIYSIYIDKEGIIWVGTTRGGISFYNKNLIQFHAYTPSSDPSNIPSGNQNRTLNNGIIGCFLEDKEGYIWIGTDGGGINIFDPRKNTFSLLTTQNSELSSNVIRSIQEDKYGIIWIESWDNNIVSYNKKTKRFKQHSFSREEKQPKKTPVYYWSMYIDSKNRFWITYPNGEIDLFNENEKLLHHFFNNENEHITTSPIVYESPNAEIYVINYDGLYKLNSSGNSFDMCVEMKGLISVQKDDDNTLWIATKSNGAFHYTNEGEVIQHFNQSNGLADNYICSIGVDEKFVWFSTNRGLSMYNKSKDICVIFSNS